MCLENIFKKEKEKEKRGNGLIKIYLVISSTELL